MKSFLSICLIYSCLSVASYGQTSNTQSSSFNTFTLKNRESAEIYFKSGTIIPENISSESGLIPYREDEIFSNGLIRIVQFAVLPNDEKKKEIRNAGIKLLDYIPNRAFLAHLPKKTNFETLQKFGIEGVGEYTSNLKIDKFIYNKDYPEYVVHGEQVRLLIHVYEFIDLNLIANKLVSGNEIIIQNLIPENNSIEVLADKFQIENLLILKEIKFIEIGLEEGKPENFNGRTLHRSNSINTNYPGGKKYDGSGVVVMMQDDGDIGPHIDFEGRVDQSSANLQTSFGNHGDHVAGTFMGAGNLDPLAEGMAPGVFGFIYGNSNNHYNSVPGHYTNDSLRITTKSYSNGCNAGYTSLTQQLDQQVVTYPSLIHVFSAGNAGTSSCGYGAGPVWGNITGGHKIGKNVIAVANVDYIDNLATSSSRGPASDGRIKPDISAKGTNVYSDDENFSYRTISGTSMACPGVTGVLAQLYQAYKELNSGAEPNSALMKAIILNSADDLGNPGPDFKFGWGRINGNKAIQLIENQQYLNSTISALGNNTHTLTIPTGVDRVKIMLYWKDPAASTVSNFSLVNDLDLQVLNPSLNASLPLVLNPSPNATTLDQPAVQGIDNLNNMEQVVIDNPVSGNYTIIVNAAQIAQGPQEYFIVYLFENSDVKLTYPIGGESLVPGEIETIRWDALNTNLNFSIDYSTDNGINWISINSSIAGNFRHFDWLVPQTVSGSVLIRVSQGANTSTSQAPFSIINVPSNVFVNWACTDSLQLLWDSVAGADLYEISMLGTKYMDSIGTSTNNYFNVTNISSSNTLWLSVKARNQSLGIIGRRAYAIRKNPGVFDCPVPNDVSLNVILNPQSSQLPSCQDLDSIPVSVEIQNKGSRRVGNFPVKILLNSGTLSTVQFNDTLEINEKRVVVFPVFANLNSGNSHFFKAWTDLSNDQKRSNDTATSVVTIFASNPLGIPFLQTFDQYPICGTQTNCEGTNCLLGGGWLNQANNFSDDIDWRLLNTATASVGTGPSTDHTGTGGNFIYLEASGNPVCTNKTAILISPCIDLNFSQLPQLSFWYHMLGTSMGELHVDILADGEWIQDITTPLIGNQGSGWLERIVDLSPYVGKIINLRFRGITGSDWSSDMAIDDIEVKDNFTFTFDASVTTLISPSFTEKVDCLIPDSLEVKIAFQNLGANAIGNLPFKFSLNGGPTKGNTYYAIVQAGALDTFTFAQALHIPGIGVHHLKVWLDYALDQNPGNDTVHSMITINPGTLISAPFSQTFDQMGNCGTATNCEATVCNLTNGWKNYENLIEDDIDWRVHNGPTASPNTGPSADQNQGNSSGKYIYLEASGTCSNKTAIIESPCIDLGSSYQPELRLWYHMFGLNMGELHLDVFVGDSWINDFAPPILGNQGNSWQLWSVDLSLLAGSTFSFRLRGVTAVGFRGDMAIDNISIVDNFVPAQANFTYSQPTCSGQSITFSSNSVGSSLNHFWDFGANASPATATGAGPHTVNYLRYGISNVSLVVSNLAGSDTNVQTLLLDTLPSVNFVWNINNDTLNFTNQSSNASSFIWDFGDGTTSNVLDPRHHYAAPGIYTVSLSAIGGCGINIITKDVTYGLLSLGSITKGSYIAYPNPTKGQVFVKTLTSTKNEMARVEITDLRGVILYSREEVLGDKELLIDLTDYSAGLYIMKITGASSNAIFKIEKE